MKLIVCGVAFLFAALVAAPRLAAEAKTAHVSALDGKATKSRKDAQPTPLMLESAVLQGDTIETEDDSRLEIRFSDSSALRIGPRAKMQLSEAHFGGGPAKRKMTARL